MPVSIYCIGSNKCYLVIKGGGQMGVHGRAHTFEKRVT